MYDKFDKNWSFLQLKLWKDKKTTIFGINNQVHHLYTRNDCPSICDPTTKFYVLKNGRLNRIFVGKRFYSFESNAMRRVVQNRFLGLADSYFSKKDFENFEDNPFITRYKFLPDSEIIEAYFYTVYQKDSLEKSPIKPIFYIKRRGDIFFASLSR
jgi:hypothetical protein